MLKELLPYYEGELSFLRSLVADFAHKYPKIAARMLLEADKCEDPHVERMLEGFAFVAARLHLKIDDEFPEIIEPLLGSLYPDYIRPTPSMSIVEFQADPQVKLTTGVEMKRDTNLYSRPIGGVRSKFRTCYDTTIWPVRITAAEWKTPDRLEPPVRAGDAAAALRLELRCDSDVTFEGINLTSLRFYLDGGTHLVHTVYEVLCNNCTQILVRDVLGQSKRKPLMLPSSALHPVGFREDERMSPFRAGQFLGYSLLAEYFGFPQKFLFLELTGLEVLRGSGIRDTVEIIFLISPFERGERNEMLETGVRAKMFRLGCAPIINLFKQPAKPILLGPASHEYPVVPDVRHRQAIEVFSIDEVAGTRAQAPPVRFHPFYSGRGATAAGSADVFWTATRRPSGRSDDDGTEMFISLVDISAQPVRPEAESLSIKLICTNRDLPAQLASSGEGAEFEVEGGGAVRRAVALTKPTVSLRPPAQGSLWFLLSQLSLNYLSLVSEGRGALQEILKLYNIRGSNDVERQIRGISNLKSRRQFGRIVSSHGITFARGTLVEMELDEDHFSEGGAYLFAAILEQFFARYASRNSFSQLVLGTRQRANRVSTWPPRAGQRPLL